jgi:hypothetical protein
VIKYYYNPIVKSHSNQLCLKLSDIFLTKKIIAIEGRFFSVGPTYIKHSFLSTKQPYGGNNLSHSQEQQHSSNLNLIHQPSPHTTPLHSQNLVKDVVFLLHNSSHSQKQQHSSTLKPHSHNSSHGQDLIKTSFESDLFC